MILGVGCHFAGLDQNPWSLGGLILKWVCLFPGSIAKDNSGNIVSHIVHSDMHIHEGICIVICT